MVYEKVPIAEAANSGAKLTTTRWVDISRGDEEKPKYRSGLEARELNTHGEAGLCAATTPLGAKKVLFSMAMTNAESRIDHVRELAFFDVSRA